ERAAFGNARALVQSVPHFDPPLVRVNQPAHVDPARAVEPALCPEIRKALVWRGDLEAGGGRVEYRVADTAPGRPVRKVGQPVDAIGPLAQVRGRCLTTEPALGSAVLPEGGADLFGDGHVAL